MRLFVLALLGFAGFVGIVITDSTDANAVVCARGVARAGCAGAHGTAVVHRPVGGAAVVGGAATVGGATVVRPGVACRSVMVNGARVRRCI
jgi:hypothetical protein